MKLLKKCVAEMIGTMGLTFIACGVAVACSANGMVFGHASYWVATALAFGFVVVAMAYAFSIMVISVFGWYSSTFSIRVL